MQQVDPAKVAIYIRWSTDDQANGTTLEVQSEACRHFVRSQGWAVTPELVFIDDGYSGGDLKRPGLTRLREQVQAGQIHCVVVFKIDRLSRSVIDTVNLVLKEWDGRCHVKSTREPIDTSNAMGKQFFYMLVSYAEWERSVIRERTYGGKLKRASEGRNAGQKYPFGYRKAGVVTEANHGWAIDGWDAERQCCTGDAAVVRRIFEWFLTGVSMPKISERLNSQGLRCPEGGREWRSSYIGRILANPIYCGRYHWGRQLAAGLPAIVSEQEFEAVQAMRRQKAQQHSKAAPGQYLLSGLAVCGKCGANLGGSKGETRRYYVCLGRTIRRECDCAYIDKEVLEQKVLQLVREEFASHHIRFDMGQVTRELAGLRAEAARNLALARAELAGVERKKANLDQQLLSGHLQAGSYEALKRTLQQEMERSGERVERAERTLREFDIPTDALDGGRIDPWAALAFDELRQLLRELVADLRVYQTKGRQACSPVRIDWTPTTA
jgi:site-specific DNA recombinase